MDVEVMPRHEDVEQPQVRLSHVKALGVFGTILAILTMFAAFGFGIFAFFGTSLLAAAIIAFSWPRIFSAEFTQWVFGTPHVEFWKILAILLVTGAVVKLLRMKR